MDLKIQIFEFIFDEEFKDEYDPELIETMLKYLREGYHIYTKEIFGIMMN